MSDGNRVIYRLIGVLEQIIAKLTGYEERKNSNVELGVFALVCLVLPTSNKSPLQSATLVVL